MTREEAIEILNTYDMSEDNDDTEFKGAIALAIKALEQEPKTGWIPVSEKKAEWPCLAIDEYGNYPFIPSGVVTIGDCCYDAKNFRFDIDEFLKGEEVTVDGEKAYILPRKIVAWMPLPEPYKEG